MLAAAIVGSSHRTLFGGLLSLLILLADLSLVAWLVWDVSRRNASGWWIAVALVGGPVGWLIYLAMRPRQAELVDAR